MENDEKEKKPIKIELDEQKKILIMMKMLLNLDDQMKKEEDEIVLLWLTSLRASKSKQMSKPFFKKVTG